MTGLGTRRIGFGGAIAAATAVLVLVLAQPAAADSSPASRGASGGVAEVGDDGGDDSPIVPVAVGGVAGLGLGLGVGALAFGAFGRRRPTGGAGDDRVPPTGGSVGADQRTALANALISLRDRLDSDALHAEIGAVLDAAGFREVVVAAGSPFDPEQHRGVDWETTHDPAHDKRVAHTERPGYLDGSSVLRPPEVVVYRLTDERTAAP